MWSTTVCGLCCLVMVGCVSQDYDEVSSGSEVDASVCSEEYESCGTEIRYVNATTTSNSTSGDVQDVPDTTVKTVKVRRRCCEGLTCIHGADEEPVASGVTDFCRDPNPSDEKERMFEKWKESLEMPRDYSNKK